MRFLRLILPSLFLIGLFSEGFSQNGEPSDFQLLTSARTTRAVAGTASLEKFARPQSRVHYVDGVLSGKSVESVASTPPVASDNALTTNEDITGTVNVAADDSDSDGTVDASTVDLDPSTPAIDQTFSVTQGNFSVDGSGLVTFVPAANYNGVFTITYTVNDDTGDVSNAASLQVTVTPVNDPPTITGQASSTINATEDTQFTIQPSDLVISDPDAGDTFTVTVQAGTNYTGSGATVTPAPNYSGPLTVNVVVNDGTVDSAPFAVSVSVANVNDPPSITGQTPTPLLEIEDTPFTIQTSDLAISDPDLSDTFTVKIQSGTNYTFSGATVTPATNYNGSLSVSVVVNDGTVDSAPFAVSVSVANANDPPSITGQTTTPLLKTEDTPFAIQPSDLVISDPDAGDTFTVKVQSGTNYTFSGATVTPAANYNGPLSVNVVVNDGTIDSAPFAVSVSVANVNDPPSVTGQAPTPLLKTEDTPFTIQTSDLVISDPDAGDTFIVKVQSGTNYTFSGATVTPAANYSGPLSVSIVVNDGTVDSAPFAVSVSVANVNDSPSITGQTPTPLLKTEDTPFTIQTPDLVISDPDVGDTFTVKVKAGANYTFSGATVTPASNYNGPLTVNVVVNDGTVDSAPFAVSVNVANVNDPPVVTGQSSTPLLKTEDTPFTIQVSDLVISDPDLGDTFTVKVKAGTNYSFSGATVTPAANYNGALTVNVVVNDGTVDSSPVAVSVSVASVNDPPVITGQAPGFTPLPVTEDTPFTVLLSHLVVSDPDVGDSFTVKVAAGTNYTFSGATVTPAANYNGSLTVNVVVNDGTVNSAPFAMSVSVASVNDPPVVTGQASALTTAEDTPLLLSLSNFTVTDVDNTTYPTGFSFTISAGSNYTVTGGNTVKPNQDYNGTLTVPVRVSDGTDLSTPFNLTITVTPVNDPPVIGGQTQTPLNKTEDTAFTITTSDLLISDPDVGDVITVKIQPGSGYTVSGSNAITPTDFFGSIVVNVTANDGHVDSAPFGVSVLVAAVNDPPTITAQKPKTIVQNTPFSLGLTDVTVVDPDDTNFTFKVLSGTNYTFSGNTVTPSSTFYGTLNVNVSVNDTHVDSAPFVFTVSVLAPPVISNQATLSVNEDTSIQIDINSLVVSDPDTPLGSLSISLSPGANYTLSGKIVNPAANYNGTLTVPVTVSDGFNTSASYPLKITVVPVNDQPVITGQNLMSIQQNQSVTLKVTDFIINDPDNIYPTDFTLFISTGSHYSIISGTTIKPDLDFVGTLQIPVFVKDLALNSPIFNMQLQVSANAPPTITGQTPNPLATTEDTPVQINLSNLTVTDPDNTYPTGFTLSLLTGSNYSFSGNTVTPAQDFNGTLTVPVTVNDGTSNSSTFNFKINVTPVNDPPKITGQTPSPIVINEDTFFDLAFTNLLVTDVDNTYPTGFTMTVSSGSNYTVSGKRITPSANFNGTLSVPVKVNDGAADSPSFNVQIQVAPVDDAPVITGQQTLTTPEDTPLQIDLTKLVVTDIDNTYPADFTLNVLPSTNPNYSVSSNKVIPAANYNGTLSVPVTVSDGTLPSNTFNLTVTVSPVNDAPTSKGLPIVTIQEDDPNSNVVSLLNGFTDVEDAPALFSYSIISNDHAEYFQSLSINSAKGELTYKLKADMFGTAKITIKMTDTGGLSVQDVLTINITGVNDPPYVDAIDNVVMVENGPMQVITLKNISSGPFENQSVLMLITSDNPSLIPSQSLVNLGTATSTTISITPAANQSGVANMKVALFDVDANPLEFDRFFTVTVASINNPPTLDAIADLSILDDAPLQSIPLTGITAGAGETQVLTVTAKTDDASKNLLETLSVSYTNSSTTGTLTIKPKANANGNATSHLVITVTVTDDGSNVSPSVNNTSKSFNLTIQPVNDLPVFVSNPATTAVIGDPYEYDVKVTDADDAASLLTLTATAIPLWATFTNLGNGQAKLVGIPPAGSFGTFDVTLQVTDPSGTPVKQQFTITIDSRPLLSPFTLTTVEDTPITFTAKKFSDSFSDADGSALASVKIVGLPRHGSLKVGGNLVNLNDEVSAASLSTLIYTPELDYNGKDTINWNGSDGTLYAYVDTYVAFTITPVNDAPVVANLETDALRYEVGSGPQYITQTFEAVDVDNDSLTSAEIGFRRENFNTGVDLLLFKASTNITGKFDGSAGILVLSGKAPKSEYTQLIRSIQYNLATTANIKLEAKDFYITLNDGKLLSDTRDRAIDLIYTFVDLDIPSAFTPGNEEPNNTWAITHDNLGQFTSAQIHVYNKRGTLVYESTGFDKQWDGLYHGELLPADSYFYTIDLNFQYIKKTYKGVVTILHD